MGGKRKNRDLDAGMPARGAGRDRLDEKRRRFSDDSRGHAERPRGLRPSTLIALGGIVFAIVLVAWMLGQGGGAKTASAQTLPQVPATTGTVESGKVSVSIDEVNAKKIVFWDYKKADGKTTPLMAYLAPSGAVKMAVRICEPCNGFSFHIEGNQIVCDSCGTRWDLETFKGISGGCQGYPPDVLSSTQADGKLLAEETQVINWKPRP